MGRRRTTLPPAIEAEIANRTARGESAKTIFQAIHGAISEPTIARRQRELRDRAAPPGVAPLVGEALRARVAAKGAADGAEGEDFPEEVPPGAPLEMIDRWIARVEKGATAAELAGNLPALSSLAMRAAALAEARRKAVPMPKADPNDDPDMRALAAQAETRLFALIDDLFAPGAA